MKWRIVGESPPTGSLLSRVVRGSIARPVLTIGVCLALSVVSAVYTATTLKFETSSVQLLPPRHLYVQRFKENLRNFGELNDIVVVVEAPNVERAKAFADRLATEIRRLPGAGRVAYRIDPELFKGQALLYLSTDRLTELRDKLVEHRRFIERYAAHPTLAGLLEGVSDEIARRFALGFIDLDLGLDGDGPKRLDPGFVDALLGVITEGMDGALPRAPWQRVFTSAGDEERSGYFLSSDDQLLFILAEARRDERRARSHAGLDHHRRAIVMQGIGGERHARAVGIDEALDHHGHRRIGVRNAEAIPVRPGSLRPEGSQAAFDRRDDRASVESGHDEARMDSRVRRAFVVLVHGRRAHGQGAGPVRPQVSDLFA